MNICQLHQTSKRCPQESITTKQGHWPHIIKISENLEIPSNQNGIKRNRGCSRHYDIKINDTIKENNGAKETSHIQISSLKQIFLPLPTLK